jgi:hypothetical protein
MSQNFLTRNIRTTTRSATIIPAVVVDMFFGKASVRLVTNGAILHNLDVVGGPVGVGSSVNVDFSKPVPMVLAPSQEAVTSSYVARSIASSSPPGTAEPGLFDLSKIIVLPVCDLYIPTYDGLIDALTAVLSDQSILLPAVEIALEDNVILPSLVSIESISKLKTVIDLAGYSITMGEGSIMKHITFSSIVNTANDVIGIKNSSIGQSEIEDCDIVIDNAGAGDVFCVSAENSLTEGEGDIYIVDCYLYGSSTSGTGYGARSSAGRVFVRGGRVPKGSTDRFLVV